MKLALSETPKTGFLATRPKYSLESMIKVIFTEIHLTFTVSFTVGNAEHSLTLTKGVHIWHKDSQQCVTNHHDSLAKMKMASQSKVEVKHMCMYICHCS